VRRHCLSVLGLLLLTLCPARTHGQQTCDMIPNFSSYEAVAAIGTTIYSSVEVQGWAVLMPSSCNSSGVTHQGAAYNKLSTVGAWVYGPQTCPSCYINVQNNQSVSGSPTGTYPLNWSGKVICSRIGTLWSTTGNTNVTIPGINGPDTFWTFNGQSPDDYNYPISINLTSTGGSGTTWYVQSGADKVHLSSTSGSTIAVSSSGTAFSTTPGDIQIVASINVGPVVVSSAPKSVTSRVPYKLLPGTIVPMCDNDYGYKTHINYTIYDNLNTAMPPFAIGVNEAWTTGVAVDYLGNNWLQPRAQGFLDTESPNFADEITGPYETGSTPTPSCVGLDTAVQHWGQEWYVGSVTPGVGVAVQTDVLYRYIDRGGHYVIWSPPQ